MCSDCVCAVSDTHAREEGNYFLPELPASPSGSPLWQYEPKPDNQWCKGVQTDLSLRAVVGVFAVLASARVGAENARLEALAVALQALGAHALASFAVSHVVPCKQTFHLGPMLFGNFRLDRLRSLGRQCAVLPTAVSPDLGLKACGFFASVATTAERRSSSN